MSSYNSINGTTASENKLLETPLSTEWGFDGVVVSDWTGVRSINAANAHQTEMPGPVGHWGPKLLAAVNDGRVSREAIPKKSPVSSVSLPASAPSKASSPQSPGSPPNWTGPPSRVKLPSAAPCWSVTKAASCRWTPQR